MRYVLPKKRVGIVKNKAKILQEWTIPYQNVGVVVLVVFSLALLFSYLITVGFFPIVRLSYIYLALTMVSGVAFLFSLRDGLTRTRFFGWLLILWVSILHFVWFFPISSSGGTQIFFETAAQTLVFSVLMWMVGESVALKIEKQGIETLHSILLIAYFVLAIIVVYGVYVGMTRYGLVVLYYHNYETDYFFNYLRLGDFLAIVSLLLMGSMKKPYKRFLCYLISSLLLFLCYSRTSFYLFLGCGAIYLWVGFNVKGKIMLAASLIILMLFAMVLFPTINASAFNNLSALLQRMTILISAPTEDESLQGRSVLLEQGWRALEENWLFGSYLNEWWQNKVTGGYVHNWLSFWISYGIGPFLFFLVFDGWVTFKSYLVYQTKKEFLPFIILLFCNAAIVFSRSYIWAFIWFALGMSAAMKGKRTP